MSTRYTKNYYWTSIITKGFRDIESHLRDGNCFGKLCKVARTSRTSSFLFSGFTLPGTESNTQSCSSGGLKKET